MPFKIKHCLVALEFFSRGDVTFKKNICLKIHSKLWKDKNGDVTTSDFMAAWDMEGQVAFTGVSNP